MRKLLHDITVDALAHVGQRRNFLGPHGVHTAKWLVRPMFRTFFRALPESSYLFDVDQMIHNALAFHYSDMAPALLQRSCLRDGAGGGVMAFPVSAMESCTRVWNTPPCEAIHASVRPGRLRRKSESGAHLYTTVARSLQPLYTGTEHPSGW